ncbi:PREDICTED: ankyrin repeat and SOCS box protein 12-like [Nicrophorus vespilloides]|uniref:Ankyrin repeat and SOCS box protein 12-like n=1 Tax=Nicrophorus vespilloides TaxID=110193 RepID=A0ABM1MSM4_NICVS|nr:PREDICTED: ankyrin repeat and SOCS box protein 12-like [Nicrophorus vespilloides]
MSNECKMDKVFSSVDILSSKQNAILCALSKHLAIDTLDFSWWNLRIFFYLLVFVSVILIFIYRSFKLAKFYMNYDNGVLALNKATYENDTLTALQLASKYPCAINKPIGPDQFTPFLRACFHGNTQLVKYMLQHGADVTSKTIKGETGLYLAVYNRIKNRHHKDASCIHTLYHAGSDIEETNMNGFTALQVAAIFGHTSLAKWLVKKNANINVNPSPYILSKTAGHYETTEFFKTLG